jgi:hypothetical protein
MEQGYNRKNDTSEQSKCFPIHGSYSNGFRLHHKCEIAIKSKAGYARVVCNGHARNLPLSREMAINLQSRRGFAAPPLALPSGGLAPRTKRADPNRPAFSDPRTSVEAAARLSIVV